MWYVIQTMSGKEHEICMWINTYVDKSYYRRCFVPLYEDVWRKEGIGHISIKRMFTGYLFLDTDTPEKVHEALRDIPEMTVLLSVPGREGRDFVPLNKEEEEFFDTILSDGIMKVSYFHMGRNGKINKVIGPLQSFQDNIVRLDLPHRRAFVNIPMLGEERRLKFGLWLEQDPKIDWIEEEKKKNRNHEETSEEQPLSQPNNPWDWKAWKKLNQEKKKKYIDEELYGYKAGDHVINTTGIYGDTPLEIVDIYPDKNSVVVNVLLFGNITRVEMGMQEIEAYKG